MSGTERRLVWLKQREQEELWGIAGRGLDGEKGSRVLQAKVRCLSLILKSSVSSSEKEQKDKQ